MKYLVFLVCFAFSFIFHFLYTRSKGLDFFFQNTGGSISFGGALGNFWGESLLFFVGGILLFFLFLDIPTKKDSSIHHNNSFDISSLFLGTQKFFSKYLYIIGFFFFYGAVFVILYHFGFDFDYFILLVNILVGILFFLNKKFFLFRDLIKISTIFSSFYFIIWYIFTFFYGTIAFTWIDFLNSFLILGYFILNIYFDKKYLQKHQSDTWLTLYFFLYFYLLISFYLFLGLKTLSFIFSLTGFLFTFVLYFYVPLFPLFKKNIVPLRILSLFVSYTSLLFSLFYLVFQEFHIVILIITLVLSVFNLLVHFRFQNYISFFLALSGFSFGYYILYFQYFSPIFEGYTSLFVATYGITFGYIIFSYIKKMFHFIDYIIVYICCYIANIYGIVSYFLLTEFDLLIFGVMFLLESLIIFLSYYNIISFLGTYEKNTSTNNHHDQHSSH